MTTHKKEIKINPELFIMRGSKRRNARRTAKVHTPRSLKAGSIKKALMRKIKSNHSRSRTASGNNGGSVYTDDILTSSLKYLDNISKNNDKIHVNLDVPEQISLNSPFTGNTRISTTGSVTPPPPPYGCLKGGNKTTYRQWKQTQKNKIGMGPPAETIQILSDPPDRTPLSTSMPAPTYAPHPDMHTNTVFTGGVAPFPPAPVIAAPVAAAPVIAAPVAAAPGVESTGTDLSGGELSRKMKLQEAKDRYKSKQKTVEKQYATFGKQKGGKKTAKKISVLIKDNKTLKKIEHEKNMLGGHAMPKVRSYLKNRGLLKAGTTAPDEVIKELYKNAYLAGDVHNKSSDVLLHNYMAQDD